MKKIFCLALSLIIIITLASCGGNSDSSNTNGNGGNSVSEDSDNNSDTSSEANDFTAQLVGRWEKGYSTNSDDENREIEIVKLDEDNPHYYEFYSNGTGTSSRTDVGGYKNGSAAVFEWAIEYDSLLKEDVLNIYYCEDDNLDDKYDKYGYYSGSYLYSSTEYTKAKLDGTDKETITFNFPPDRVPLYVKVDSSSFIDNPDLGNEDAFNSIHLFRADEKAYKSQFEDDED